MSLVWLVVVGIFFLAVVSFNDEIASPSLILRIGQVLPYLGLLLTGGTVVATLVAWSEGYGRLLDRVYYSIVTVVALLSAWQLYYWQVIGL